MGRTGEKNYVPHPKICIIETKWETQNNSHIGVKEDGLQNQILEDTNISKA